MKYRALDPDGDYSFGKSMQEFVIDNEAVAQAIGTNLRLLQGEWWEDLQNGLPLFQNILAKNGSSDHVKSVDMLVKDRILSTEGVASITVFNSSLDNRVYSATCSVRTTFNTVVSVEVIF